MQRCVGTQSLWAAVGIHGGLHLGYYLAMNLGVTGGPATEAITLVLYALIGYAILRRLPAKASAPAADQVAAQALLADAEHPARLVAPIRDTIAAANLSGLLLAIGLGAAGLLA